MNNIKAGEAFEQAIFHWRDAEGRGTALIPPPLNDLVMVLGVLQRVFNKRGGVGTTIIVNVYSERQKIIDFLTIQPEEENNKEFKKFIDDRTIKILSADYVNKMNTGIYLANTLCILYHVSDIHEDTPVHKVLTRSRFSLIVWNKLPKGAATLQAAYSTAPLLKDFEEQQLAELRTSTPIEETLIDVSIPEDTDDYKLLEYYNDYIATSLNIFGSFEIMQQCRLGNLALNISAAQICDSIARENGWNEHLNMNDSMSRQIDELFNPGNLKERASETYNKIRLRMQLLTDYKGKLDVILKLTQEHKDKNILIFSKRAEFAKKITNYLNEMSGDIVCGDYHDQLDPIVGRDDDGNVIRYKTGKKKGEIRYFGDRSQRFYNQKLINEGKIHVLSANNAPDKDLCCKVDVVIITSPICESIESFIYRLSNIYFDDKIILYTIFVKNSIEEQKLQNKPVSETHVIVNNCENRVEIVNNSDYVIVD